MLNLQRCLSSSSFNGFQHRSWREAFVFRSGVVGYVCPGESLLLVMEKQNVGAQILSFRVMLLKKTKLRSYLIV